MKPCILIFLTSAICNLLFSQTETLLLRSPSINSDGSQIAFSYQGDIWTCSSDGGEAKRKTIHEAYESNPQWSPSDDRIAFTSSRHGNNDIFVMNSDGHNLKRINYHSASDTWPRWASEEYITFSTKRNFVQVEKNSEIHQISAKGGTPVRILDSDGDMPTISPDGRLLAFVRGNCRTTREAYRGPAQRDIWIFNTQTKEYHQISKTSAQDISPDFGGNNELFYLSAETGRYNIYKIALDNDGSAKGKPKRLTNHKEEGIRSFDVSIDGKNIVYEHVSDIFIMKNEGKARKIDVVVSDDFRFYPQEKKKLNGNVSDFSLSPDEKYLALVAHGEVFIKKNDKDKKQTINISNHSFRELQSEWLNDSTLLYMSDRSGNYDLYLVASSDSTQKDLFKTFKRSTQQLTFTPEDEVSFSLSPDRKQISIISGNGKLMVADIDEKGNMSNYKTLLDGWAYPYGIKWSPDNKWLAYSKLDLNYNREVYIHAADNSMDPVNISLHPRNDYDPVWSQDGSKLGFLSIRNYGDADIWFVWLSKEDWEKSKEDWEEDEDFDEPNSLKKKKGKKDETEKDSLSKPDLITIDFENIHERIQQVTRFPGNEDNLLIDKEGEVFYFTTNGSARTTASGKPELKSIKWDGSDEKTILSNGRISNLQWDKKGIHLYGIQSGGHISKIKVDGGKTETLNHDAMLTVDHEQERRQIFEELCRTLHTRFYDPDFHGQDFEKLKIKYNDRALNASTTQDFRDMVNEMLGQVNASHMGLYNTPNPEDIQSDKTGFLGIEVIPDAKGVKITHVIQNSPADKRKSKLIIGDIITHINGYPVTPDENFYKLLDEARNKRILLRIDRVGNSPIEIVIRPTSALSNLLYDEWVNDCKKLTDRYSGGRLGYIHVKAMGWAEFESFERELMASGNGKEGIVIDVRYNGGGWTTDMLMAVLDVRQHAYTIPRGAVKSLEKEHKNFRSYYAFGERLPTSWWTKPSIAMCNESSYSNAEIFSHAYKNLGLGTLVGKPTFGAVISTGSRTLMDGSYVRLPFRGWYVKKSGENMEHSPAIPDIIIDYPPDSRAKGEDPQLKAAVEELLRQIDN